jgi:hypothetical protein
VALGYGCAQALIGEGVARRAGFCAAHAGFITGQNLLLDGGQYRGLM